MSGECDICDEHALDCWCFDLKFKKWHETKKQLPRLGEVVECVQSKEYIYSKLERDYFALVTINDKLVWITPSMSDIQYDSLQITHWRHIPPDPKGRKPFIKIKVTKRRWEPKIIWVKLEDLEGE